MILTFFAWGYIVAWLGIVLATGECAFEARCAYRDHGAKSVEFINMVLGTLGCGVLVVLNVPLVSTLLDTMVFY